MAPWGRNKKYEDPDDDDDNDGDNYARSQGDDEDDQVADQGDDEDEQPRVQTGDAGDDDDDNGDDNNDNDDDDEAAQGVVDDDDENDYAPRKKTGQSKAAHDEHPRTTDADEEELIMAGAIMMKHLMAQSHNQHADDDDEISHKDVEHTSYHDAEEDARIVILRSEDSKGQPFHLEAKMDTGADKNLINTEAALAHGLEVVPFEGPEGPSFTVGTGASASPDGLVKLSYRAGQNSKRYTEEFYAQDALPRDIILGYPFLEKAHAVTINPDFASKQKGTDEFLLYETAPATKESKAKMEAFRKQKREEREAAFKARLKK